jgi:hydroxymethylpyrimidine/phosphomethylpyrimidine kinase
MTPIALSIAGSDPSAGAGIQADLKTFSALGVYGATVITALTAQNTRGVSAIEPVRAAMVSAQIDAVFADLKVDAVKIGMLGQATIIEAVAAGLDRHRQKTVVLDPVLVASASATALLAPDAIEQLRHVLIPRALILTPNLPEAAALLGEALAETEAQVRGQAERLLALGAQAVLIKGGHAGGAESVDIYVDAHTQWRLPAPRILTNNTHGTGCTLSAAIAAGLAKGLALAEATAAAKDYVTAAIAAADRLSVGSGRGPLHHFQAWWSSTLDKTADGSAPRRS